VIQTRNLIAFNQTEFLAHFIRSVVTLRRGAKSRTRPQLFAKGQVIVARYDGTGSKGAVVHDRARGALDIRQDILNTVAGGSRNAECLNVVVKFRGQIESPPDIEPCLSTLQLTQPESMPGCIRKSL
jgi:hypothetical protein